MLFKFISMYCAGIIKKEGLMNEDELQIDYGSRARHHYQA